MQRVRIGIMGLAGVFLLVVLSAALYSLFGGAPDATAGAGDALSANTAEAPREPLAELGVTPGNLPAEKPPAPKPAPRPQKPAPSR